MTHSSERRMDLPESETVLFFATFPYLFLALAN